MDQRSTHTSSYAVPEAEVKTASRKTLGEWCYFLFNNFLLGAVANVAISFTLARDNEVYKMRHGKSDVHNAKELAHMEYHLPDWFHKMNDRIYSTLHPLLMSTTKYIPKNLRPHDNVEEDNKELSRLGTNIITNNILIGWSGLILSFPQTWLSNHKLGTVKALDNFFDGFRGDLSEKTKQNRKLAYARIEENLIKESIFQVLGRRLLSMGIVVSSSFAALLVDPHRKGMNRLEDCFNIAVDKLEKVRGKKFAWSDGDKDTVTFSEKMASNIGLEIATTGVNFAVEALQDRHKRKKQHTSNIIHMDDFCEKILLEKQNTANLRRGVLA